MFQADNEVNCQRYHKGIQPKGGQSMKQYHPADNPRSSIDVGDLESSPDRKREVDKVHIVRSPFTGKIETSCIYFTVIFSVIIVKMGIMKTKGRVNHHPG